MSALEGGSEIPVVAAGSGRLVVGVRLGRTIYIGRDVKVTIVKTEPDGFTRLSIEAPKFRAISRDDVPFDRHLEFCEERERASGEV